MTQSSKHVLVLRFSAMGDVALLTPVLKSFLSSYPDHTVTVVSRPRFASFFVNYQNLNFFPADVDSTYSGIGGIAKLVVQLHKLKPSIVIDLHDHVRSRFMCFLLRISGTRIVRFDKGRLEKKQLTRRNNKIRKELPHTVERYADAFKKAGYPFSLMPPPYISIANEAEQKVDDWLLKNSLIKKEWWYGLAPFAAHKTKIWPVENYFQLIEGFKLKARFFLFGGGKSEIKFFNQLKAKYPNECVIVAGELKMDEELALMKRLDKVICVDSSNMHLASLLGVPTISIWGGTHPGAGFGPFGGNKNSIVQVDANELDCRPCSVYGKEKCWREDMACLNRITIDDILPKL